MGLAKDEREDKLSMPTIYCFPLHSTRIRLNEAHVCS